MLAVRAPQQEQGQGPRAAREKIMRPASLVRTAGRGRIRLPPRPQAAQGRCVRASPAQMPASTRKRDLFRSNPRSDLAQLPCQISQVSELSLCLSLSWIPIDPSDVLNYYY